MGIISSYTVGPTYRGIYFMRGHRNMGNDPFNHDSPKRIPTVDTYLYCWICWKKALLNIIVEFSPGKFLCECSWCNACCIRTSEDLYE
jgi:hypothetical protein